MKLRIPWGKVLRAAGRKVVELLAGKALRKLGVVALVLPLLACGSSVRRPPVSASSPAPVVTPTPAASPTPESPRDPRPEPDPEPSPKVSPRPSPAPTIPPSERVWICHIHGTQARTLYLTTREAAGHLDSRDHPGDYRGPCRERE